MSTINNRFENETLERLQTILTTIATVLEVEIIDPATGLPMTPAKDSSVQTVNTSVNGVTTAVNTVNTSVGTVNTSVDTVNTSVGTVKTSVDIVNQTTATLNESVILLRRIAKLLEPMSTQDANQRQRITIGSSEVGFTTFPSTYGGVDGRWQIIDWARTSYNTGIRANIT